MTAPDMLEDVKTALEKASIAIASAEVTMVPQNTITVRGSEAEQTLKLLEALEDHDDVLDLRVGRHGRHRPSRQREPADGHGGERGEDPRDEHARGGAEATGHAREPNNLRPTDLESRRSWPGSWCWRS